jgi:hypothetical protein
MMGNPRPKTVVNRPLLFVDIDGVLNPFGGPCPDGFVEHQLFPNDDPVRICAAHGDWLHELAGHFELVWGTSWSEQDRALLASLIDLPMFHGAIELPRGPFLPQGKAPAIARFAGDRAMAWIDDVLSAEAWTWASDRSLPTLLLAIDRARGLERQHVEQLMAWALEL